jgi:hypothetical protein
LLAYLDDTLDPAQTKLIGQKVAESATAQELIARIKDVVRRRRLTVGNKLDPNTVADYIDSVLPSEQLTEVEEICLGSDVHLAEIAACHQILTVVLSEPILVPPTAKRRMYGLIKGREAIPYRKMAAAATASAPEAHGGADHDADDTLLLGLPSYRRQGAWFRRLAPVAAVLLLGGGLAFALWRALPSDQKNAKAGTSTSVAQVNDRQPDNPPPGPPVEPEPPKGKTNGTSPAAVTPAPAEANPAKPAKPEEPPKEPAPAKPASPNKPAPADSAPPQGERRVVGKYVAEDAAPASILLQRPSDEDRWQRLRPKGPVSTNDSLVSLPGYRSEVRLDNGVGLTLWGNLPDPAFPYVAESAAVINDNPEIDLDVTLDHGRIAVTNYKASGPAKVRVRFLSDLRYRNKAWEPHYENWDLTLGENQGSVALELIGLYLPGVSFSKEPGGEGPMAALALFALKGQTDLHVRYDTFVVREPKERGPSLFVWDNMGQAARGPQPLRELPPWAAKDAASKQKPETRKALETLSGNMQEKALVDITLVEALKERDPEIRRVAVYCLGAIDDLPDLLQALEDEEHGDVRFHAVMALRHWMALRADNDQKLYQVLEKKYKAGPAEIIMVLLHSFSQEELAEAATYDSLISYLKNDKLPIRELAFSHLSVLARDIAAAIPYDPAGGSDQRERAYDEWQKKLREGKLPPKPMGPPQGGGQRPGAGAGQKPGGK